MKRLIVAALAAVGIAAGGMAQADDFMPAVVFDMGGKFDKSFNEAAFNGAEKFTADTGIKYREFEVTNPSMREQALRNMARRGAQVVVAMGFAQAAAVETVAQEFPDTKFTLIDMVVDLPNVQSVIFKEHEGSFLVGMAAAMASETGKVGFVGGMDIPLIRKFALGYVEGAQHVNPDVEIFQNMTGTTPSAWNDPTRGGELARSQFDRGRGRGLRRRRRHGHRRLPGREGCREARHRGGQQPELHPPRHDADLDGQARGRGGLRVLQGG